jgi:hypothetical protein
MDALEAQEIQTLPQALQASAKRHFSALNNGRTHVHFHLGNLYQKAARDAPVDSSERQILDRYAANHYSAAAGAKSLPAATALADLVCADRLGKDVMASLYRDVARNALAHHAAVGHPAALQSLCVLAGKFPVAPPPPRQRDWRNHDHWRHPDF